MVIMNWDRKLLGMKPSWPVLRYYPIIYLKGLRKSMKTSVMRTGLRSEAESYSGTLEKPCR
jgi:hypothetical protein